MITLTTRMVVSSTNREKLVETLLSSIEPTRVEGGCQDYQLLQTVGDEDVLALIEKWEDFEAYRRHMRNHHFKVLLEAIELLKEAPQVEVCEVVLAGGIERLSEFIESRR